MWFAAAHNISCVSRLGRPKNPRNVPQARDGGPLPSWQRVRSYRTRSQDVVAFAQTFAFVRPSQSPGLLWGSQVGCWGVWGAGFTAAVISWAFSLSVIGVLWFIVKSCVLAGFLGKKNLGINPD